MFAFFERSHLSRLTRFSVSDRLKIGSRASEKRKKRGQKGVKSALSSYEAPLQSSGRKL